MDMAAISLSPLSCSSEFQQDRGFFIGRYPATGQWSCCHEYSFIIYKTHHDTKIDILFLLKFDEIKVATKKI